MEYVESPESVPMLGGFHDLANAAITGYFGYRTAKANAQVEAQRAQTAARIAADVVANDSRDKRNMWIGLAFVAVVGLVGIIIKRG